jgi:hypothetical protein
MVVKRIIAIALVYFAATIAWVALGSTISYRTDSQDYKLKQEVGQLWGIPLEQRAPWAGLTVERPAPVKAPDQAATQAPAKSGVVEIKAVNAQAPETRDLALVENNIRLTLNLDQRQKGLLWYSMYRVRFEADYVFENPEDLDGEMAIYFAFPAANGIYDEFKFEIDGAPSHFARQNTDLIVARLPCKAKSRHTLKVHYTSQGLDRFLYRFGQGISEVRNFQLTSVTDFDGYDHPANTLSPTLKERQAAGWHLAWNYKDLISGNGIGIEMPQNINPGPMAARISYFAPVSLGFFFFLIFIISVLKGVEIHPMNFFFLAASFFAFHLLLAYLVDHMTIHAAFVICSLVSIIMVVSYMRIVVGNRFAFIETALAQAIYLIGFSYAFFIEGFTGLAVTVGAIVTLFIVMQMTAKINWSERFQLAAAGEDKPLLPGQ